MHQTRLLACLTVLAPLTSALVEGYERVNGPYNAAHGHGHLHKHRRSNHHNKFHQPQFQGHHPRPPTDDEIEGIVKRQSKNTDGQCGPSYGSCASGYCCSAAGWCGNTKDYCAAPDALINYGDGADANTSPPGSTTSTVKRTKPTTPDIVYGNGGVYACTVPGTVALTFDDGPYDYTSHMLDLFDKYNSKATWFITGNNLGKGPIDNPANPWSSIIKRMHDGNHQLASHTWSHQDLSTLTTQQLQNQIYWNEMAFRNILGYFPIYMRPPYSSCGSACQSFLADAGYHIIYFDQDTSDYLFNTPELIQISKNYITGNLSVKGDPTKHSYLVVGHDIDYQEAYNLTEFMLQKYTDKGFKMVTVGDCLGDPKSQWYYTAGGAGTYSSTASSVSKSTASSSALPSPTAASSDGSCGPSNRRTCLDSGFGNCCSQSGWCGKTSDYCGTGCQSTYGLCGSDSASRSASSSKANVANSSAKSVAASNSKAASATSSASGASASKISTNGQCGKAQGTTCLNSGYGNCCSSANWCGSTSGHCGDGCQTGFGVCGSSSVVSAGKSSSAKAASSSQKASSSVKVSSSSTAGGIGSFPTGFSTDGKCGPSNRRTCLLSSYGNCCSADGECGRTSNHCSNGCQSRFGLCGSYLAQDPESALTSTQKGASSSQKSASASKASSAAASLATGKSSDGQCGPTKKTTCLGSGFGDCCSPSNWCGSSSAHCGDGCQTGYGSCTSSNASSAGGQGSSAGAAYAASSAAQSVAASAAGSAPASLATGMSTDGQCGPTKKTTCLNSGFGDCCSPANWCGSSSAHCGDGCQTGYGSCTSNKASAANNQGSSAGAANAASSAAGSPAASQAGSASASLATGVSSDGQCGPTQKTSCLNSGFGDCCSAANWCGSSSAHCGDGCQSGYGSCLNSNANQASAAGVSANPASSAAASVAASQAGSAAGSSASSVSAVSKDGTCGPDKKTSCLSSGFGDCCSVAGWCGSTDGHCLPSNGCQAGWGTCTGSNASPAAGSASSAGANNAAASGTSSSGNSPVSQDGTCGGTVGNTCQGSSFGTCCSASGWCGSTDPYCGDGCQSKFGTCSNSPGNAASSSGGQQQTSNTAQADPDQRAVSAKAAASSMLSSISASISSSLASSFSSSFSGNSSSSAYSSTTSGV